MSDPVLALVGRPNVGKSTLFNRLTRSRDAIVANVPGLTRDRQYGDGVFHGQRFIVIDTGGLTDATDGVEQMMAAQAQHALEECDHILFVVDARQGRSPDDDAIADRLRRQGTPVTLVANKIDGVSTTESAAADFHGLGLGEPRLISASHGRGIAGMLSRCLADLSPGPDEESAAADQDRLRIAVIGRPNVGKSTLINRFLGEERVVVFDQAGTTRDSIFIPYEKDGRAYTLIDTAGIRRRGRVNEAIEKFSVIKALDAMARAHVSVLMIDAREGIVEQDLHLLSYAVDAGRALVIAVNKWDGMSHDEKQRARHELERRLVFIDYARQHFISALHGSGVGVLYKSIHEAYDSATGDFPTHRLTEILERAVRAHEPPMVRGRRIKLRYAHQGGSNPPRIVIHGNQTGSLSDSYQRYLERTFRSQLKLTGTPVKIELRTSDNPYAGKKNTLTERQSRSRQRMIAHAKRSEKKRKNRR